MVRKLLLCLILPVLACAPALSQGSCASPANPIVAENCLPGADSSQWEVSGSGDPTIQGFADDISINAGQTINFKIKTTASAYTIKIFRLGYYGGMGARQVATVAPSAKLPQSQPACLTDANTDLYDCGNWAISASWAVPATAVSGVYLAVLTRSDTGGASLIVFVVRNDSSKSDMVFQTSDESWQAYNPYGGHSLYGGLDTWDLTNRAYKVSYNRPFNTPSQEIESWIFYAEMPMIRWLEANGYNVSYISGVDTARNGSLLTNHKIFLSVGHDEYWSGPQRANVEAARAAGVNLAFFSGNGVFWKTRWENSIDGTNTPYRTMVCYKETLGPSSNPVATAAVDPLDPPVWTGTWRDPTNSPPDDGGRPENALQGTIFAVNGPGTDNTDLSIKVPAADGKMRFWRNTAVANQTSGQVWTLPASTLGYEWDIDADNGFRPAGLIDLSTAKYQLTNDLLLDYGGDYGAGTATHHLTYYRYYANVGQPNQTPLGLVFGAGTAQWSFGLDSNHTYLDVDPNPDTNMQQATVNLFADMGVQPATLQPGLLAATQSTDTIAPTSQITFPTAGTQVLVGSTVNITGTAQDNGGGVVGGVEISVDGGNTWHPASGRANWTYAWTPTTVGDYAIESRATDDSGNLEIPSTSLGVTVTTNAQTLTSLTLSATSSGGGTTVQGAVTLGQPAASGGVVVTLSSSNTAVATVPASVTVPAGQFSATFPVSCIAVTVPTQVTISATYVATSSATLTVTNALPPPPGNLAIDALVAKDQTTASSSIQSGPFSTSVGNELVLALIATDGTTSGMTVSSVTGAGLTWTLVERTNTQFGTAEIWRAFASSPVTNATAIASLSQSVDGSIVIVSFAGVDTTGTNGSGAIGAIASANAVSGAPTATLISTRNNSIVLGVGNDWDKAIARQLGPNQTMLHQDVATANGDTYWMQMQTSAIPTSGTTVTLNDTSPTTDRWNLSTVEVLPAPAGTLAISGTITPASAGSGATITLTGSASVTSTADSSGTYSFQNLGNGSYVVTPSKPGVIFTPSSAAVSLSGANSTANFTAATLQSIFVTPSDPTVTAGNTEQFTATGTYTDGSTQNVTSQVTWSSSDLGVATVNSSGLATSIAGGTTTIVASFGVGETAISGSTPLTVQATALVVTTTTLPGALQGQAYAVSLAAKGGTAPYTWSMANGTALPAGLTLSTSGEISGTPTAAGTANFTIQVTDAGSPVQTATQSLSIVIASPPSFYTIWTSSATPTTSDAGADSPVELGVAFESTVNGTIGGIRFYKSTNNTGTHVGNLWSSSGTLLGSATFTNESASGWQQVNFSTPIAIMANTVYVASYHTTVGHYAADGGYFLNAGINSPPLQALQNGTSQADGVYSYGTNSTFPSNGFNSTNYWVDVVFTPATTLSSIVVTPANPTIQAGGTESFTATGTYSNGTTQNLTGQVTWSSSNATVATINSSGIATGLSGGSSTITATLGSVTNNTNLTVQPATLAVSTASLPSGTQNVSYAATLSSTGGTLPVTWKLINNTTLPPGLTLSSSGQITGVPTATGTTAFTVQATDSSTPAQTASQNLSITISAGCPCSISGNIVGTGSSSVTVKVTGGSSITTTTGSYSLTGLANGTYTITPSASGYLFNPASQTVTVNNVSLTGINFAGSVVAPGPLIDANVSSNGSAASTTIATTGFSTKSGNELLLAFVETDDLQTPNTTVTSIAGGGLTWALVARANVENGDSEIWRAFSSAPLSNITVSATLSQSVISSITVLSYTGVDTTGTNGSGAIGATATKGATTGAPSVSLVTTRDNSWVFGVGNDYDNAIARTPSSGQTLVSQDLTSTGDTYWVQMQNSTTASSGTSVAISDTAPTADRWNLAVVEVLPSLGSYSISGTVTPAGTGATVSLSGPVSTSTTVDASGNYTFAGLPNGAYTVTPTESSATFTPASQAVTINSSNVSGIDFAAVQPVLTLSQSGVLFTGNVSGSNPAAASINITNTGGGTLDFTAASDSNWLAVSPASGTAPGTLQISASTSGMALGTYVGHVTVSSTGSSGSPTTITVTLKVVMPTDWLMVEHDEARSGIAVDETTLSTANVGSLALSWTSTVDAAVTAQPLYIHSINIGGQTRDVLLVGTGNNSLYMLDASNGTQIWKRNFGAPTPNTWGLPDGFGIEAPPYIDRVAGRVYTVSTDGNFHVLNLTDGTDVYTPLPVIVNPTTNKVWGGLNKAGNTVYFPSASNGGDVAPWRGQVYGIDVSSTPTLVGDFVVVPSIPAPNGGGGIWGYGGVSIDLANGNVYAASANDSNVSTSGTEGYTPYSDSMIALNSQLVLLGYYQPQQPSTYSCSGAPCDLDFASTPLIFQPTGCPQLLAAGNKDGNLFLFRASDLAAGGQPLQILNLNAAADSLGSGGIGGTPVYYPATNMLYIADAGPGVTGVAAGLVALNVTNNCTLQVAWSDPLGGNDSPNSTPTVANGIVFVGQGNSGAIHAYNASTGAELWHSGSNYGAAATFAAPIVAGGKLYAGSWTSFSGGGIVGAFSLPSTSSFSISGNVSPSSSGAGATLTLTGASTATVTADSNGNFSFSGLSNGTYTVTPSEAGFSFNPTSTSVTVNNGNVTGINFTATAQTWAISGNLSSSGAGATVALAGSGTASVTADSSGIYTFNNVANGTYTVTPTKSGYSFTPASQSVTVNGANLSNVNFTATATTTSLAIDAKLSTHGAAASKTIATTAFSTKAGNELVVAFIATDYLGGTNTTVTGVSGAGLTWTLVKRTNAQNGDAEIWAAFASTVLANVSVTATLSQSVVSSLTVLSFTGVDTTLNGTISNAIGATGTGNSVKGAPTASLTTSRNNSWVFGVGNDFDNAINRTPGTGQSIVDQFLTSTGDTYWVQMENAPTPVSGTTVTINDTAPSTDRYNLTTVEVRTP